MSTEASELPDAAGGGSTRLASSLVAAGILLSRISGLVREAVFSRYFGTTGYADVFRAGLKMPNLLQNLLGEGTLSASFIPVYSRLLEDGRNEDAGRTAGAVLGLLAAAAGALVLFGVLFAPQLVTVLLPGFDGERRALAIEVVRIVFPMTGLLVLSAWALGILNSHRSFFIGYVAPVIWNAAIIGTMLLFGGELSLGRLVVAVAWGALLGGLLQFLIQLPAVLRLERHLRPSFNLRLGSVQEVMKNATPAIVGRGVVQLSGYIDVVLSTLLAVGAVATIGYAQTLYLLPVSLFGMSVAAAELPELSRRTAGGSLDALRLRTNAGLERIAFFVIPSFVAFVALGDVVIRALYGGGRFGPADALLVYLTLIAFSVGLLASTGTRLFSSTFFALRDTRTPARYAIARVLVAAALGFLLMAQFEPIDKLGLSGGVLSHLTIPRDPAIGPNLTLGAVGLALGSGIAAWFEWALLRRNLRRRLGPIGAGGGKIARMFLAAAVAAAAGWGVRVVIGDIDPIIATVLIYGVFGLAYLAVAAALHLSEATIIRDRLFRLFGRRG